jgi:hypothetical protein
MIDNYRLTFAHAADQMILQGDDELAEAVLDSIMVNVPFSTIPGDFYSVLSMARAYEALGDNEKMLETVELAEPILLDRLTQARSERDIQRLQQFIQMIQFSYFKAGEFEKAAEFREGLAAVTGDTALIQSADELREVYGSFAQPQPAVDEAAAGGDGPPSRQEEGDGPEED